LVDDLPLFTAPVRQSGHAGGGFAKLDAAKPLLDRLDAVHPDELTPRDALELVYELKKLASAAKPRG
jgi:DNA mismatch repair protein MutS